ncbi:MAG: CPBP family intramembrane metalloprotease [Erysipelotrichaceae bacterium]|nr:CPBP family intramembrane metalloprotease [Erysipelotrichaceae bacterium]
MITRKDLTVILSVLTVAILIAVEQFLHPSYWVKTLIKIQLFMGSILIYCLKFKVSFTEAINLKKKEISGSLIAQMIFAFVIIIIGYFIFRNLIDLSFIGQQLLVKEKLSKTNFVFAFAYIIIVNSFLEESFFRGFVIHGFGANAKGIRLFSAILFAIYHVGIISNWFLPVLMIICLVALAVAGLYLEGVAEQEDTIMASWLVHGCANLAINLIGSLMILGM